MQKFKLVFYVSVAVALAMLIFVPANKAQAQTGRASNITYRSTVDNVQMGAVLWTPGNFNAQGAKIPLFVYLHGGGGTGQVLLNNGGGALTRELDARRWLGIAPDGRRWNLASRGCDWQTSAAYVNSNDPTVGPGEQDILDAINWAIANYPVDTNRIYLSGFSMGGRGTYQIGLRNPDLFAAIAPFAPAVDMYEAWAQRADASGCHEVMPGGKPGDSLRVDTMFTITSGRFLIENAFNLPVFHAHGTQDNVAYNIPTPGRFQHGAHILTDASWNGCSSGSTGQLCFGHTPTLSELRTRHPEAYEWAYMFTPVGHTVESRWVTGAPASAQVVGTADPQNPANIIGAMNFLSRFTRKTNPETVIYKSYTSEHRRAYWTEIDIALPWQDMPGAIRAKRNNAANSLDVELSRVATASFDLSPAGLRLAADAPLTINLKLLNEAAFDPALIATDVPLEPKIVLKGNFAGLTNLTVLRNGTPLAASLVTRTDTTLTIGAIGISAPTTLTVRADNTPAQSPVASVSAASFKGDALAPDSIIAAFGNNLANGLQIANTTPLPTSLGGATVKVKDSANAERPASLFFVSPNQLNYLLPAQTALGQATVTVTNGNAVSTGTIQVSRVAPGLFTANGDGKGLAVGTLLRVKANGTQSYEPLVRFDSAQGKTVAVPIEFGAETDQLFLLLFGTGMRLRSSLSAVTSQIGGVNTEVLFVGEQGGFSGLDQVNLRLPSSLKGRGEVDVVLTIDGQAANTVKVTFAGQT